jgi:hypothetical protein
MLCLRNPAHTLEITAKWVEDVREKHVEVNICA